MTTKFIDLFCGVGGFRLAADWLEWECVFSSDIDAATREVYRANFGSVPSGDIRSIEASALPDTEES